MLESTKQKDNSVTEQVFMQGILHEGSHRVSPKNEQRRIYLEGVDYARAGFEKGTFLDIKLERGVVRILASDTPKKHKAAARRSAVGGVSKTIIDLNFSELTKALGLEGELSSVTKFGEIEIRVHHEMLAQLEREQRCKSELKSGALSVGSICTGIGVSVAAGHEALKVAGINGEVRFICDIEQKYLDVFQKRNPAMLPLTKVYKSAIESMNTNTLPLVSKLSFSLPCTNHSSAGKSAKKIASAEEDSAATSLFGLMRVVNACNPAIIESENVAQAKDSLTYQLIRSELKRKGYQVFDIVLDQENGGCIEARKRYYFVAISSGLASDFSFDDLPNTARIHESVADVLDDEAQLLDVRWWPNTHFDRELADKKSKGLCFSPNFIEASAEKVNVIRRQYAKHQISSPFFSDGEKHRLFTQTEIARLQRTDERLVEDVSRAVAIEGLGQGVSYFHPFNLTLHYVQHILRCIRKKKLEQDKLFEQRRFEQIGLFVAA